MLKQENSFCSDEHHFHTMGLDVMRMSQLVGIGLVAISGIGCPEEEHMTEPVSGIPVVSVVSPMSGEVLDTTVISVTATDDNGVTKVEIYIDDVIPEGGTFLTAPYSYVWDVNTLSDSSVHTIIAKGYDADGHSSSSATLSVTTYRLMPAELTATLLERREVELAWGDNSRRETSYEIEMSTDRGSFDVVEVVGRNETSSVVPLPEGNSFLFRVSGVSGEIRSRYAGPAWVSTWTGWVVGDLGTILHTTDGGSTWTPQTSGTSNALFSVYATDSNTAWVVGNSGTILKTTNGGAGWSVQESGTQNALYSAHFANSSTGWAVGHGGVILKTSDGGALWSPQGDMDTGTLLCVRSIGPDTAWAGGVEGHSRHTTDGGSNWSLQLISDGGLHSVFFLDGDMGWAAGVSIHNLGGQIRRTTDGGGTWSGTFFRSPSSFNSVHFTDSRSEWVVGIPGSILHSSDGGTSWGVQASLTTTALSSIVFADANSGWTVGEDSAIFHTTDGGIHWNAQASQTNVYLTSVHIVDPLM